MITLTVPVFILILGLSAAAGRVGVGPIMVTSVKVAKVATHPVRHPKHDAKAVGHFFKGDR